MMVVMNRSAAVAALVLFCAAPSAQEPVTVKGRIVGGSTTGPPVAGNVTVFVHHDGALVTNTTTASDDGFFALDVPSVPYEVLIWGNGYAPRIIDWPSEQLILSPFRELRGSVSWNGTPVEGAFVQARHEEEDGKYLPGWMADSLAVQRTNDAGEFVIHSVIPHLRVAVRAEHVTDASSGAVLLLSATASIAPSSEATRIELQLNPAPESEGDR